MDRCQEILSDLRCPLRAAGMLQQLFNAADTAIVGRFDGRQALAAVGSNTMVISLFVNMFVGLSIGANVVIAKYVGQRQEEKIKKSVHTVIFLAVLSGLFLLVFGQMTGRKDIDVDADPGRCDGASGALSENLLPWNAIYDGL